MEPTTMGSVTAREKKEKSIDTLGGKKEISHQGVLVLQEQCSP
jgi:hypothetical protein